jgi:hypothetical protein
VDVGAAALAIVVVVRLTQRQHERADQLAAPALAVDEPSASRPLAEASE